MRCACGMHAVNPMIPGAMALCQIKSGVLFCRVTRYGKILRLHGGGVFAGKPVKRAPGEWQVYVRAHDDPQPLYEYGVVPRNGKFTEHSCVLPLDLAKEYAAELRDSKVEFYGCPKSSKLFASRMT